jgi:hypothetical protein
VDDPRVLPRRDVLPAPKAARKEVLAVFRIDGGEPFTDRHSGLLSDLELDRSAGFALDHSGAVLDLVPNTPVTHSKPHEVATSELAIDGQIEECKVAFAPL